MATAAPIAEGERRGRTTASVPSCGGLWGGRCRLTPEPAPADEKQGERLPPCAVVATLLLMRAPQKSCSQKGGRGQSCVSSQPPTVPTGRQEEFCSPHWAPQPTSQNAFWRLPTGRLGVQLQQQVLAARIPVATQVCARLAVLPRRNGLRLQGVWPAARTGAVSPHGGKIMIVLVFMGHNITSVGGSVVAVVFRGYGRLQHACCCLLFEGFGVSIAIISSHSLLFTDLLRPLANMFMTPGGLCFQPRANSSFCL